MVKKKISFDFLPNFLLIIYCMVQRYGNNEFKNTHMYAPMQLPYFKQKGTKLRALLSNDKNKGLAGVKRQRARGPVNIFRSGAGHCRESYVDKCS